MTGNENWAETLAQLKQETDAAGLPRPVVGVRALGTSVEVAGLCTRIRPSATEAAELVLDEVRRYMAARPQYIKLHSVKSLVDRAMFLSDGANSNTHAGFADLKMAIRCLSDAIMILQEPK